LGIARQQPLILLAYILNDGPGLEDLDRVVAIDRHLFERLFADIFRGFVLAEQAYSIVEARLFKRPTDA
jgi:hypothetical protein